MTFLASHQLPLSGSEDIYVVFRIFLLAIIFVVGVYTFPVVMDYGLLSLFPNFF